MEDPDQFSGGNGGSGALIRKREDPADSYGGFHAT
jgi:hypothetical protein